MCKCISIEQTFLIVDNRYLRFALPFCKVELKASKPLPGAYPERLDTIGDHIRKKRLDMKLKQSEVAEIIGVTGKTICNWEKHRFTPDSWRMPNIFEFLGYVPDTLAKSISGTSLGEKIIAYRKIRLSE